MLQADRVEFERQVSLLCAAYNVPVAERAAAYWVGFGELSLVEFARLVEHVLKSGECERMPTVSVLHAIRRKLAQAGGRFHVEHSRAFLLTEAAMGRFRLSEFQKFSPGRAWQFLYRDPSGPDCECVGLEIPADPADPSRYPAQVLRWSEYAASRDEA